MPTNRRLAPSRASPTASDAGNTSPFARRPSTSRPLAVVARGVRLGHQHADVLADDVGRGIAEHELRGSTESDDLPEMIDYDDRIDRRIEQGLQLCGDHGGVLRSTCRLAGHT
jgi:hypothetical protein